MSQTYNIAGEITLELTPPKSEELLGSSRQIGDLYYTEAGSFKLAVISASGVSFEFAGRISPLETPPVVRTRNNAPYDMNLVAEILDKREKEVRELKKKLEEQAAIIHDLTTPEGDGPNAATYQLGKKEQLEKVLIALKQARIPVMENDYKCNCEKAGECPLGKREFEGSCTCKTLFENDVGYVFRHSLETGENVRRSGDELHMS